METVFFQGIPCQTQGRLLEIGEKAPCFTLVGADLNEIKCSDYKGKRVVLNIFPSIDTDVCAMTVRQFNQLASEMDNTVVLCVSMDLPFAAKRFCAAEGIKNVTTASAFRSLLFAENYGMLLANGPLAGLLARAVIILDEYRNVIYRELVNEITDEPNYAAALDALKGRYD
ncbi:MAG: thiol peroxidase [Muribaculaceae bacterium]|nr:thiol peroxidase [Muribaculaceae bacterium]